MPLSQYFRVFPDQNDSDYVLLYSTRQASLIRIHKDTLQAIQNNTLSTSDLTLLSDLGFMTADKETERQHMLGFFDGLASRNNTIEVLVVLNLDCNFSCKYCFQGSEKRKQYMSGRCAERVLEFISRNLTGDRKNINITFYGGEPLLSFEMIEFLSIKGMDIANRANGVFTSKIVTNGSLFTPEKAAKLKSLGLRNAKITLDGPSDIHDHYRPFKSGKGSFDAIIKNIKAACDMVDIHIGGNYDQSNYRRYISLLDFLESEGLTPDRIAGVKFDPIVQQPADVSHPGVEPVGCLSAAEPWIMEAGSLLREEILKRGYYTPKPRPFCCMVEDKNALVINVDGTLYKCPGFIGKKEFAVGNIDTGLADVSGKYHLDNWKNPTCLSCEYLPLCFGGCRYMQYIEKGRISGVNCIRDYFDGALEKMIIQDITYRSA